MKKHLYAEKRVDGKNRLVHRVVVENYLGRKLERFEHVHHVNGDTLDNRIENLQIVTALEHVWIHRKKLNPVTWQCERCGNTFVPPSRQRGGKRKTCSSKCALELASIKKRNPSRPHSLYRDDTFPSVKKRRRADIDVSPRP